MSGQSTCLKEPNFPPPPPDKPGIHFTAAPSMPPDGECSGWDWWLGQVVGTLMGVKMGRVTKIGAVL